MIRKLLTTVIILIVIFGCKKVDTTPSWVRIDAFTLTTNEVEEGANSHNITDAWVFMDGKALGVYELPCKFPVLAEGEHEFVIYPGIKNNGISSSRMRYPFYTSFEETAILTYHDTLIFEPKTAYSSATGFAFIEDFESAGIAFVKGPTSDTNIRFVTKAEQPEIVQYGDKCGLITLQGNDTLYAGSTQESLILPKSKEVFLEIDYRNNNSLATGVISGFIDGTVQEHTPLVILNPQDNGQEVWKKIYINLSEDVSAYSNSVSHEFYLLASLDDNVSEGNIYIDNIKVVYAK